VRYTPADQGHYESAVWDNPRKPGEGAIAYIVRIAELVAGAPVEPRAMPAVRLPYPEDRE
jgi:hypothetical protein